jgi:hypothetical protein
MTRGIKISVNCIQELYINSRYSNDPRLKDIIKYTEKFYPQLLQKLRNDNTINRA